jgi:hypothetical protein
MATPTMAIQQKTCVIESVRINMGKRVSKSDVYINNKVDASLQRPLTAKQERLTMVPR